MDPLSSIVTALVAGAAAALQSTVQQSVKDAYTTLKTVIKRRYAQVNVEQLEVNPSSKSRRGVVEENLTTARADQDIEVLQYAKALLEIIQRHAPETAAVIGVELTDIEGAALSIRHVTSSGSGVKVERAILSGDITIEDIRTGGRRGPLPNPWGQRAPSLLPHFRPSRMS